MEFCYGDRRQRRGWDQTGLYGRCSWQQHILDFKSATMTHWPVGCKTSTGVDTAPQAAAIVSASIDDCIFVLHPVSGRGTGR